MKNVYTISFGDGRSSKELLDAGKYAYVSCYAADFVGGDRFHLADKAGEAEIELVELQRGTSTDEALAELVWRGLERPTEEDALRFGEKYPEVQLTDHVVFLHEPYPVIKGDGEDINVLTLGNKGGRILNSDSFSWGWMSGAKIAGRRPRKT